MESVDAEVQRREWESTTVNKISSDLSNALSSGKWVIKNVWRTYVPSMKDVTANPKAVIGFWVCLEPELQDHAVAVAVGAKLNPTLPASSLWDEWTNDRPLLTHLAERPEGPLPLPVLQGGFLPNAIEGAAFLAPLMELTNMAVVRTRLLDRAFAAAK
jgi:hypothetical protein